MLIYLVEASWPKTSNSPSHYKKFVHPLLWALSLATYIKWKESDYQLEILDGQLISNKEIKRRIKQNKPTIVGICPRFNNYKECLDIARSAKKIESKVVFGGVYASVLAKEILNNRGTKSNDYCIDAIIKGEDGEKSLFEYIKGKNLADIANLSYCNNQRIIKSNSIEYLDLDKLPFINRDLLCLKQYSNVNKKHYPNSPIKKTLAIYSQKGCSWKIMYGAGCIHCIRGSRIRTRSVEKVWQEINYLIKKYQIKHTINLSQAVLDDLDWIKDFCEYGLNNKIKMFFNFNACPPRKIIDLEIIKLLKEVGVKHITLYIGSIDEKINLKTNIGGKKVFLEDLLDKFQKERISFSLRIFLGGLGETKKSLNNCLDYLNNLALTKNKFCFVHADYFSLYPGCSAWHLLNRNTKNKYKNVDLIDYRQVFIDWVNLFCKVSLNNISETRNSVNKLGRKLFKERGFY